MGEEGMGRGEDEGSEWAKQAWGMGHRAWGRVKNKGKALGMLEGY